MCVNGLDLFEAVKLLEDIPDENIAVGSSSRVIKKNLVKKSRNIRRNCREEGRLQDVLQTVWQVLNTWHPRRLHQPNQDCCTVEAQSLGMNRSA